MTTVATNTLDETALIIGVTQQMYRYARAVDRMDAPLMLSCFRPDAHILYGGKFEGTPQGFVDWLWPVHATMDAHTHLVSNVLVDLQADGSVASESYVLVTLRMTDDNGQFDYLSRGRYLDNWEQHDGGVRIVDRLYISDYRTIMPVERRETEGFLPTNEIPPVRSSRDTKDASYTRLAL